MLSIELEVYFKTEETYNLEKMGLLPTVKDCEIKLMTFYNIDAIGSVIELGGFEYGLIRTGTETFSTVLTYEELKQVINL